MVLRHRDHRRASRRGAGARFVVVHPLDDVAEGKVDVASLGRMPLTGAARVSLLALRLYLATMTLLLLYHLVVQR
jgi:hypothetical protein